MNDPTKPILELDSIYNDKDIFTMKLLELCDECDFIILGGDYNSRLINEYLKTALFMIENDSRYSNRIHSNNIQLTIDIKNHKKEYILDFKYIENRRNQPALIVDDISVPSKLVKSDISNRRSFYDNILIKKLNINDLIPYEIGLFNVYKKQCDINLLNYFKFTSSIDDTIIEQLYMDDKIYAYKVKNHKDDSLLYKLLTNADISLISFEEHNDDSTSMAVSVSATSDYKDKYIDDEDKDDEDIDNEDIDDEDKNFEQEFEQQKFEQKTGHKKSKQQKKQRDEDVFDDDVFDEFKKKTEEEYKQLKEQEHRMQLLREQEQEHRMQLLQKQERQRYLLQEQEDIKKQQLNNLRLLVLYNKEFNKNHENYIKNKDYQSERTKCISFINYICDNINYNISNIQKDQGDIYNIYSESLNCLYSFYNKWKMIIKQEEVLQLNILDCITYDILNILYTEMYNYISELLKDISISNDEIIQNIITKIDIIRTKYLRKLNSDKNKYYKYKLKYLSLLNK
jgi:hypothetical protein